MPISKTATSSIRRFGGTYAVIPSETINLVKNPDALAMLVWLLDRSEDWVIRRDHLRSRFGLGRHRYDNAMRELKELGLAWIHEERDPKTGQIIDRVLNVGDVPLESVLPKVGKPTIRETPTVGKSDHLPITDYLPITDVIRGWEEWAQYRKEIRKSLSPSTIKKQVKFLEQFDPETQQAIIDQSITNGWTGLFQLKGKTNETNQGNNNSGRKLSGAERTRLAREEQRQRRIARESSDLGRMDTN